MKPTKNDLSLSLMKISCVNDRLYLSLCNSVILDVCVIGGIRDKPFLWMGVIVE